MKLMKRNLQTVYYCLYRGKEPVLDSDGNETGEYKVLYGKPVKMKCSVSAAKGFSEVNPFGNQDSYDKVIVVDNMRCPVDENTVFFIDSTPGYYHGKPTFDYTVHRVAKSLNSVSIAVSKVKTS